VNDVGRYRRLYIRLWRHPGFRKLSDSEKILALYLLTGPQTNRLGLYGFSVATAAEDLSTVPQTLTKRLGKVCETFSWAFDKGSRVLYIPTWFKWNPPDGVNVMKGSLKDLNEIPSCGLVDLFARNVESLPDTVRETFIEGLRQRLPKGIGTQEQYQDQEQEQEQEPRASHGKAVAARRDARAEGKHPNAESDTTADDLAIAHETLKLTNPNGTSDELVDAFGSVCQAKGKPARTRARALEAIHLAQIERRQPKGRAS